MSKQYAVIGSGKFGFSATIMQQAGKEVLAVDSTLSRYRNC